jgi:hypothetical protein
MSDMMDDLDVGQSKEEPTQVCCKDPEAKLPNNFLNSNRALLTL